jgi:hypothetical protein
MSGESLTASDQDRRKAAELYERARELEMQRDYFGARQLYEQSLQLNEDEKVTEAYLRLLATIGPM